MNYSEAIFLLVPLRLLPLEMSPSELRNLIQTPLEGIPLQLDHLLGFVLYLVYVSGISLLDNESTLPPELVYWGVYGIPDAFWLPELLDPTTHQKG